MKTTTQQVNSTTRSDGIDFLRGALILLVIIGHVVLGSRHDNWIRYSIHAFHMPLFIGLTGYLLNAKALSSTSFVEVAMRYWWRLIVPFSFAFIFFTGILLFHANQEGRVTIGLLLSYFHTPYYHLWFIPTMVLWVLAYRFFLKTPIPIWFVVFVFSVVSLYWASFPKAEQFTMLAPFVGKKVMYFFSFFLFGAWLRTESFSVIRQLVWQHRWIATVLIIVCSLVYLQHIGFEKSIIRAVVWFALNILLIALLVPWSKSVAVKNTKINSWVVDIGRNSLPIYLWHVLPLFLLKGFDIHQTQPLLYYICSIIATVVIVQLILRFEARNSLTKRLVYGA